jgi:hypothetical protein
VRRNSASVVVLAVVLGAACSTEVVSFSLPETSGPSRYVHYTCCQPTNVLDCAEEVMGSETTCSDAGVWKASTYQSCEDRGLMLTAYTLHGSCGSVADAGATAK